MAVMAAPHGGRDWRGKSSDGSMPEMHRSRANTMNLAATCAITRRLRVEDSSEDSSTRWWRLPVDDSSEDSSTRRRRRLPVDDSSEDSSTRARADLLSTI